MFFTYRNASFRIHRDRMMVAKQRRNRESKEKQRGSRDIYGPPRVHINAPSININTPTRSWRRGSLFPAYKFSDKELKDLRICFSDIDANGSGRINKAEMKGMLKKLGCFTTDKEFESIFREIDINSSGKISFDEFLQGVRILLSPPSDDDLVQKFRRLDQGNKGYLNFRDIKAGFAAMNHPISDRAINDMIAVASQDGDDQVSFEEFCAIAKRPRKI
jgi:Ca2+-binding EF-hand superfamily protein